MAHKPTLHTGYHSDILQVWRAAAMRTKCRVENVPLRTSCLRKSFGGVKRQGEAFQLYSLALSVLICCHKTW